MNAAAPAASTATRVGRDVAHVTVQPHAYYLRAHREQLPLVALCGTVQTPGARPLEHVNEVCDGCLDAARRFNVQVVPPGQSLS